MVQSYHGQKPCIGCQKRYAGCIYNCKDIDTWAKNVGWYLMDMDIYHADVVHYGFVTSYEYGGVGVVRTIYVQRAFRWDAEALKAELQQKHDRLVGQGHVSVINVRQMNTVSERVHDALVRQHIAGFNGVCLTLDKVNWNDAYVIKKEKKE